MKKDITVIGCGVIGLSTGIRLLEAGHNVQIITKELPHNTTSNWAAAVWFPYHVFPFDKVLRWGANTFDVFQTFIDEPKAGVQNTVLYIMTPEPPEVPWWGEAVPNYSFATADELPSGYKYGYKVDVPVCDTTLYLNFLMEKYKNLGGSIEQKELQSIDEVITPKGVIINCTGLGSYKLVDDTELYPVRGQVVKVKQPDVKISLLCDFESDRPAYIFPRTHDIILGGTAQEGNWDESIDPDTSEKIIEATRAIMPELASAEIIEHGVGLRPGRPAVRLELEHLTDDSYVIHNYGHGGAGFTLSWGCADEVVQMVKTL